MNEISLCGAWRLRGKHGKTGMDLDLPATVPGCVHTDLLQNGIIENFFEQDHARALQWIETEGWMYTAIFISMGNGWDIVKTCLLNTFLQSMVY